MTVQAFYRNVMRTSGEHDHDLIRRVSAAVLHALRDRLTRQEGEQVVAQLPMELKRLWEVGDEDADGVRPIKMHRDEFYERVRLESGLGSVREARWMTLAVFAALKEQLSPGEAEDVLAQLPKDLKEIWTEAQVQV
jgi:uncharacterized protein (DUF2267 family)